MARGATAKLEVIKKIEEAFGDSFIGEFDKKVYVWANDGGEMVQISIALACPKNYVGETETKPLASAFPQSAFPEMPVADKGALANVKPNTEMSEEEKNNIARLIRELGL